MNNPRKEKLRAIRNGLVFLAFAVVILVGWQSLGSRADAPRFETEEAVSGDIERVVVAAGKIETPQRVEVRAQVSALIDRVFVDVGDRVRVGQVLALMDKSLFESKVSEAEARVRAARLAAKRDLIGSARARLDLENAEYERQLALFRGGIIARQTLDRARHEKEQAVIELADSESEEERLEALVAQAEAALEVECQRRRKTTVSSPIDGVVLTRLAEPGLYASAELNPTPLFTLGTSSSFRFYGEVAESEIDLLRIGVPVDVEIEEIPNRMFAGRLETIFPAAVEKANFTRVGIRVTLDANGRRLRDQATARVSIPVYRKSNAVIIQERLVQYDGRQPYVEVPDPSLPEGKRRVDIKVGVRTGIKAEVLSGLGPGDRIISIRP